MKDTTIAVGLAKNVFEIAISRESGEGVQATPCESTQLRNELLLQGTSEESAA